MSPPDGQPRRNYDKQNNYDSGLKDKIQRLIRRIDELEKEKREILDDKEEAIDEREERIKELEERLEEKDNMVQSSAGDQELIDSLREEKEDLQDRNRELEEEIDDLREEKNRLLRELDEAKRSEAEGKGINLPPNTELSGDIQSESKLEIGEKVTIIGNLKSDKDIILGYGGTIEKDIVSEDGAVKVGNGSVVKGKIRGREVHLAPSVEAGDIEARESIIIEEDCKVKNVTTPGDVDLRQGVKVDGSLKYGGGFSADKGITITDSVLPRAEEEVEKEMEERIEEEEKEQEENTEEECETQAENSSREENELSKSEVIEEFQTIKSIGPSMAERLYNGDFRSIEEIKNADQEELMKVDGIGRASSEKIMKSLE